MLNQRQLEMLLEFCKFKNEYLKASYFVDKFKVSLRTVQNDIKTIKNELENETFVEFVSKASKGTYIIVKDTEEFSGYINSLYQQYTISSLSYPNNRINQIMMLLLNRHRAISFFELEDSFFISRSTLINDLKKIESILESYGLELLRNNNKVMIDGFEINKRRCLMEQDLYLAKNDIIGELYIDERQLSKIKNILTEIFVNYKYHIMDNDFSNMVLLLNIAISRIMDGFYIQSAELDISESLGISYDISKSIFEKISQKIFIKVIDEEVKFFALYLNGHANNRDSDAISEEMSDFVLTSLISIRDYFGVDFTDNINMRITLALHCMSLKIRVKYDMQMKNDILDYIRGSFPLGYDMAMYFAFLLYQKYGKKVTDDEISLIALHFYSGLMEYNNRNGNLKILVFTSLKQSMTLLLRQTLFNWFSKYISKVDFVNSKEITDSMLDNYNVFLTTEKDILFEKGLAMYIDSFPTHQDYMNMKLYIDGFKGIDDVIQIFRPELFCVVDYEEKTKILEKVCDNAEKVFGLQGLNNVVLEREEIGSTFFSKQIAIPHPMQSISSDTFISVCISKKSVVWDEENNEVNLIMLLHVGKNNTKAFQVWDYVSKLLSDKLLADKILETPTYDKFIYLIKTVLEQTINS